MPKRSMNVTSFQGPVRESASRMYVFIVLTVGQPSTTHIRYFRSAALYVMVTQPTRLFHSISGLIRAKSPVQIGFPCASCPPKNSYRDGSLIVSGEGETRIR